jgi:hypothetical protein
LRRARRPLELEPLGKLFRRFVASAGVTLDAVRSALRERRPAREVHALTRGGALLDAAGQRGCRHFLREPPAIVAASVGHGVDRSRSLHRCGSRFDVRSRSRSVEAPRRVEGIPPASPPGRPSWCECPSGPAPHISLAGGEPLQCQRAPAAIAAQALEVSAVVAVHVGLRVEGEFLEHRETSTFAPGSK